MNQENEAMGMSRRRLLQAAGVAAAGVGIASMASGTAQAATVRQPFTPRGRLRRRPNFLIIMMDEQRSAPVYETPELQAWRRQNLPSQEAIRRHGFEFTHHHIMSTACQPSRTSIFTGQYPSLHGVAQTSGAAKAGVEKDLYWLDPATVPTLGNWFRAAGYDTYWKGKWHVSDTDLYQPGSYNPIPSYTNRGERDPYLEEIYLEAGILESYGFTGFVGPEPHGSNPLNSGSSAEPGGRGRDEVFAEMSVEQLNKLRSATNPWLMVASFVNPHDITLWGEFTVAADASRQPGAFRLLNQLAGSNVPERPFGPLFDQSSREDLSAKPAAQGSFVDTYPQGFQPLINDTRYHRFYYQLQKEVDQHIGTVLNALTGDKGMYRDTVVIYLSDHGDLLGAHGGMYQKWFNSYDEMLRVPFIFHNPQLFGAHEESDIITSHADLLPTMLGLAGLAQEPLLRELRKTHTEVRPLVGRDLSGVLLGEQEPTRYLDEPVYFMSDDQVFRGAQAVSLTGMSYQPVVQPASVESVIAYLPSGPAGARERWKYVRYWDNPGVWSNPGTQDVQTFVPGKVDEPGKRVAVTTVKTMDPTGGQVGPAAEQFEMYNVTQDPTELTNLFGNPDYARQQSVLADMLDEQRELKRLSPTEAPWADGELQQFPYVPN